MKDLLEAKDEISNNKELILEDLEQSNLFEK